MFSIYYTVLVNQLHPSKYILSMYQKLISMNMSGGQNYLLPVMDMAKVGGPLSVVKVCTSMLCARIEYR